MKSEDSEDKVSEDSEDMTSKEQVLKILKKVSVEQRSCARKGIKEMLLQAED